MNGISFCKYRDNQQSQSHSITDTNHKLIEEGLVGEVLLEHADVLEDGLDDGVDVPLTVVGQLHRHQHQAEPDQEKILLRGNKAKTITTKIHNHHHNLAVKKVSKTTMRPKTKTTTTITLQTTTMTTTTTTTALEPGHEEVLVCGDHMVGESLLLEVRQKRTWPSMPEKVAQVPAGGKRNET